MAGIGDGACELDQERLEADPQLQGGLAVAAGVEVGAGAQQQRLAGVDLLAAAEDRRDPFLGRSSSSRRRRLRGAGADVDPAGVAEAAGGDLLAAAVADRDPLGVLGGKFIARVGVAGGDRLGVEGPVSSAIASPTRTSTVSSASQASSSQRAASSSPSNFRRPGSR